MLLPASQFIGLLSDIVSSTHLSIASVKEASKRETSKVKAHKRQIRINSPSEIDDHQIIRKKNQDSEWFIEIALVRSFTEGNKVNDGTFHFQYSCLAMDYG